MSLLTDQTFAIAFSLNINHTPPAGILDSRWGNDHTYTYCNSQKNGLFVDSDGETRYYVDGVATYAGLVYWDGYFYYFNSSMKAVHSRTYWPTVTNDLIPVAQYTFDEHGRITNPPVVGIDAQGQPKNGIYADADGEIRYYVDGVATYAKLVYCNGHYYYIGSSLKAVRDTTHWVSATNGLMEAGSYTFDAQGRMIDPPEDALTEAISTFALTGETMSKTYEYVYASGKLMRQVLTVTIGNSTTTYAMDFFYDASGYPFAVKYNGDLCYYITNLQGDVMSIVDAQGEVVAEYEYDPYGNIVSQSGPLADVNPLRYRGYVYNTETQFYYLQSRYYDPELGRFINADAYASTGQGVLGNNMFAYCGNNPVVNHDPSGLSLVSVFEQLISEFGGLLNRLVKAMVHYLGPLSEEEKVLIATIAAEGMVAANKKQVSSNARQAMANVALNRVGSREWKRYKTVVEICAKTGFDGFGNTNYHQCMDYLDNRDFSNEKYEQVIWDVLKAYVYDITDGCQLYYTPAAMSPEGAAPNWNFDVLTEVIIPGVDTYYEARFFKYK